jgi:hypothetical protein
MRRNLSTWLFSLAALLLVSTAAPTEADWPRLCLPPLFEHGRRLHERAGISVAWLRLLLQQHEVCWRAPRQPNELRVFLYGDSAVFGHPLHSEDTVAYHLNEHFDRSGIPAHIFNLGFAGAFQLKDALIMRASLAYQPDVIVYAVTLSEFDHFAPCWWPGIVALFDANRPLVLQFAAEHPAGLQEPLEIYRSLLSAPSLEHSPAQQLRQLGAFVRTAAREEALRIRRYALPNLPDDPVETEGRQNHYDCAKTKKMIEQHYSNWQTWNILAYLREIRDATGIPVLVVNWPVANEPVDDCYNVRYTNAALREYNQWLAEQVRASGFSYVDLYDFLSPEDFVDSLHVTAAGHRKLAERLAPILDSLISDLEQTKPGNRLAVRGAR